MKKQWNILAGDNRGSGIIVVLISMVCVGLMGASLLFMSYTAMRLKVTERQASKDFYSVETAVDEIRAGMQSVVSEAIASSYKCILETYGSSEGIETRFENQFVADLMKVKEGLFTDVQIDPVTKKLIRAKCDVTKLKDYVSRWVDDENLPGVWVERGPLRVETARDGSLVINGITAVYTADNGYKTEISTDISVGMPEFVYTATATNFVGLPQHALIAGGGLEQIEGVSTITINGSAYVDHLSLGGAANSNMTVSAGTLVCAKNATIDGSSTNGSFRFVTDARVRFWAGGIIVKGGSSVDLGRKTADSGDARGETRVLNDLELAGGQAKAILSGGYYGFGNGYPNGNPTRDDPAPHLSSAILVNGLDSKLDVSNLSRLMLAGRAFISSSVYSGHNGGADGVITAESISVRSNQQMYLIDPAYLDGVNQNPEFTDLNAGPITATLNSEGEKLRETYGFTLVPRQYTVGGQKLHYYFMVFNDISKANAYFQEYLAKNGNKMNNYLGATSDLNLSGIVAPGHIIQGDEGTYTISVPYITAFDSKSMLSTFNQLKTTLIDANAYAEAENPYEYIVNTDELSALNGRTLTFTLEGESDPVGMVISDEESTYIYTGGADSSNGIANQSKLRLIISAGNVTVKENYTGLIICGGKLTIDGQGRTGEGIVMTANPDDVIEAFTAESEDETQLKHYLDKGTSQSPEGIAPSEQIGGWNLNTLVAYKNWTKS